MADEISIELLWKIQIWFLYQKKIQRCFLVFEEKITLSEFNVYNLIIINDNKKHYLLLINFGIFFYILTFAQFYKWFIDSDCIYQSFKIIK